MSEDSPSDTFPKFRALPPELRTRIWEYALDGTAHPRNIRVTVYHRLLCTMHGCQNEPEPFCGEHGHCPKYVTGQPSITSKCMSDGYFATSNEFPEPEDPESSSAILHLNLACKESRRVIVSTLSKTLRVYRGQWHSGVESRLIRCRPATDILLLTALPDLSTLHTDESVAQDYLGMRRNQALDRQFPGDPLLFAEFRQVLSLFQHVAFIYLGCREPSPPPRGEDDDDYEDTFDFDTGQWSSNEPEQEFYTLPDFKSFLFFVTALKSVYVWPHPKYWPEVWGHPVRVEDVSDLRNHESREVREIPASTNDVIHDHAGYLEVQNSHFAEDDHDQHWVPRPQPLRRIGGFVAGHWLQGKKRKRHGFKSNLG